MLLSPSSDCSRQWHDIVHKVDAMMDGGDLLLMRAEWVLHCKKLDGLDISSNSYFLSL